MSGAERGHWGRSRRKRKNKQAELIIKYKIQPSMPKPHLIRPNHNAKVHTSMDTRIALGTNRGMGVSGETSVSGRKSYQFPRQSKEKRSCHTNKWVSCNGTRDGKPIYTPTFFKYSTQCRNWIRLESEFKPLIDNYLQRSQQLKINKLVRARKDRWEKKARQKKANANAGSDPGELKSRGRQKKPDRLLPKTKYWQPW